MGGLPIFFFPCLRSLESKALPRGGGGGGGGLPYKTDGDARRLA